MTEITCTVTIQISKDSDVENLLDKFEDELALLLENLEIGSWCIEIE